MGGDQELGDTARDAHIVWLKRILRIRDHAALDAAAKAARASEMAVVIALYVYEPEHLESVEYEASHHEFINTSLAEVERELAALSCQLITRSGRIPDVFADLKHELQRDHGLRIRALYSHEETGLAWSFARDLRVAAFCREHEIHFREFPQFGVIRRLQSRDGWASRWQALMAERPLDVPTQLPGTLRLQDDGLQNGCLRTEGILDGAAACGLGESTKPGAQPGGTEQGRQTLASFLRVRGRDYPQHMSSPLLAESGCSRLSPHIAWGTLSLREIYHATSSRLAAVSAGGGGDRSALATWRKSLLSFGGRLRWHCHFIQKLESEPAIEFENINRGFDGLREREFEDGKFAAWCEGKTGYPMIDACMRAVQATGWINFRMRAMLVSFASYHLWLHWRRPAQFLARHFLDFEPGIHFSQFQMQSGVTGMNTIRIYSPRKQALDQDPDGDFIRRWVPELEEVPTPFLAEPHRMPGLAQRMAKCRIGVDYPEPVVPHEAAYQAARTRMFRAKARPAVRAAAAEVFEKHGSRRTPPDRRRPSRSR